jgi:hypothetical protein
VLVVGSKAKAEEGGKEKDRDAFHVRRGTESWTFLAPGYALERFRKEPDAFLPPKPAPAEGTKPADAGTTPPGGAAGDPDGDPDPDGAPGGDGTKPGGEPPAAPPPSPAPAPAPSPAPDGEKPDGEKPDDEKPDDEKPDEGSTR